MAISDDLFLAMDAYNRGHNAHFEVDGNQIGNVTGENAVGHEAAEEISFFAQSYTWNGQTSISYRGIDDLSLSFRRDIYNGWGVGTGSPAVSLDVS